jgi:tagatose-6-phosphate ketose/aldose isomerase
LCKKLNESILVTIRNIFKMSNINGNTVNTGKFTKREIAQQPQMWIKTFEIINSRKNEIESFLKKFSDKDADVILTGAGSSAFIGNAVFGVRLKYQQQPSRRIPNTELITHPEYFLQKNRTTVLVSFGRSGDSPESLAAVKTVDNYCAKSYHLIFTCNENGKLYLQTDNDRSLRILLPPETNDVSLAMTSSFSSMMLAFILISKIDLFGQEKKKVIELSNCGSILLSKYETLISDIANLNFKRAVFLGSGPLIGTAEESHLKMQELTDGHVICAFNSFLGFRHGPRVIVNNETLLVYLFSDDKNCRKYEFDLIEQINETNSGMAQIAVYHKPVSINNVKFDLDICLGQVNGAELEIEYLCVLDVMISQLLGYYKSLNLGLNPDAPSVSGTISRVVEGVKIYDCNFN